MIQYAILYNVFCCWMVTVVALSTARHIFVYRSYDPVDRAFAQFWFLAALMWAVSGMRLLWHFLEMPSLDRLFFYIVQAILVMHIVPATLHVLLKLTDSALIVFFGMVTAMALGALSFYFTIVDGVTYMGATVWASEYELSTRAFYSMFPVVPFCILGSVVDLAQTFFDPSSAARRRGAWSWASLVILMYFAVGVTDAAGLWNDWRLLATRAVYLIAAVVAYAAYTWSMRDDELAALMGTGIQ